MAFTFFLSGFTPSVEIISYIRVQHELCSISDLQDMWAVRVALLLTEKAQAMYRILGTDSTQDYKILKMAILDYWINLDSQLDAEIMELVTLEQFCSILVKAQRCVYCHWLASLEEATQTVEDCMGAELDCPGEGYWTHCTLRALALTWHCWSGCWCPCSYIHQAISLHSWALALVIWANCR
uniref:SCAN box domain-containing protein n=1 Tax=Crocodylus porosus TaxID=8502 RepID=A0A7M4F9E7_CROPO